MKIQILFEDEDYVIADKPAGLLTLQDRYDANKPFLLRELKKKFDPLFVVHRIDKETSGCLCFAKNENSHKYLSELFASRQVNKTYKALVKGNVKNDKDTIDAPITEDKNRRGRMMCHEKGKHAITHYEVLERFQNISYINAKIETGRTHQIRVHFKHIHHPLMIDKKYGSDEPFFLSKLKGKKYRHARFKEERPLMSRLSLHAHSISFTTSSGKLIQAEAPLPKDFKAVLNQLRKLSK